MKFCAGTAAVFSILVTALGLQYELRAEENSMWLRDGKPLDSLGLLAPEQCYGAASVLVPEVASFLGKRTRPYEINSIPETFPKIAKACRGMSRNNADCVSSFVTWGSVSGESDFIKVAAGCKSLDKEAFSCLENAVIQTGEIKLSYLTDCRNDPTKDIGN